MSEPRIVSPEEAQQFADAIAGSTFTLGGVAAVDLAHTVATEPDRIRLARHAAVLQERARVALFETARACDHCNAKTGQWVEHERSCPEAPEDEW